MRLETSSITACLVLMILAVSVSARPKSLRRIARMQRKINEVSNHLNPYNHFILKQTYELAAFLFWWVYTDLVGDLAEHVSKGFENVRTKK